MSDNIFKELCNRIFNLFKQTESEEVNAKDVARNRLRVVLMQDRTNLTPDLLQRMRKELIELLSKYVEMDKDALELNFDQEGDQMALMLSIPVLRAKDESEIEEALAKDENKEDSEDDEELSEDDLDDDESDEGDEENHENGDNSEEHNEENSENNESSDNNSEFDNQNDEIEITEGDEHNEEYHEEHHEEHHEENYQENNNQ